MLQPQLFYEYSIQETRQNEQVGRKYSIAQRKQASIVDIIMVVSKTSRRKQYTNFRHAGMH